MIGQVLAQAAGQTGEQDLSVELVLGIIGTVSGLLALGWQIAAHFLTAGRVRVTLRGAWIGSTQYALVPAKTFHPAEPPNTAHPTRAGVAIRIANVGRLPVTVTEASVAIGKELAVNQTNHPHNAAFPKRLEVGAVETWVYELDVFVDFIEPAFQQHGDATIRARAAVGTGKPRFSRESIEPSVFVDLGGSP